MKEPFHRCFELDAMRCDTKACRVLIDCNFRGSTIYIECYDIIMSGFKAELEGKGALEIVREVDEHVCYTRFLDASGEWAIGWVAKIS